MGREPGIPGFTCQGILGHALGATPVKSEGLQQRLLWIPLELENWDSLSEVTRMNTGGGHLPVSGHIDHLLGKEA